MNSKIVQLLSHWGRVYALHEDGSLTEVLFDHDGQFLGFKSLWTNR